MLIKNGRRPLNQNTNQILMMLFLGSIQSKCRVESQAFPSLERSPVTFSVYSFREYFFFVSLLRVFQSSS